MSTITINNANFYYELHGNGQPLILIAGYGANGQSWMPIVNELSKHFQVLIFDNRAIGQTNDNEVTLSAQLMAKDVIDLCEALHLKKPHIVGRSMGGNITQTIAATYPDKINKIGILVSSAKWRKAMLHAIEYQIKMQEQNVCSEIRNEVSLSWLIGNNSFNNEFIKAKLNANLQQQSLTNQKRQFQVLKHFDGINNLKKIKARALIAYGNEDILALPQESRFLAQEIPNAKLVEFDCAHLIVLEQTTKLIHELITFLKD